MSFIGAHHAYRRHRTRPKGVAASLSSFIDKSIFLIGFLSVAANFPQLWEVWVKNNTSGVSLLSWTGFFVGSIFWFTYGWIHKELPIMAVNGSLIFIQAGIILGLLLHMS